MAEENKAMTENALLNNASTPVAQPAQEPAPTAPEQAAPQTAPVAEAVDEAPQPAPNALGGMTDEETANFINQISEEYAADNDKAKQSLKSIWQAWKDGDIDKDTRNYFLVDSIAKFASNMSSIANANTKNSMWSNIKSGERASPELTENTQWGDYLQTDWKEAQKLKNEAKSKEKLGQIENSLNVAKQAGMDKYLANEKPEMLKNSTLNELAKEDPGKYTDIIQMSAVMDGRAPFSADQLGNIYDAEGNAKLGNKLGEEALKAANLSNVSADIDNMVKKYQLQFDKDTEDLRKKLMSGQVDAQEAANELARLMVNAQQLDNEVAEATKQYKIDGAKADYWHKVLGGSSVKLGPITINAADLAAGGDVLVQKIKEAKKTAKELL